MSASIGDGVKQTINVAEEIEEMKRANSEAFSILGMELAEVKSMLMVILDLQKAVIYTTGMSEEDTESHVQTLLDGYRERFISSLENKVHNISDKHES